MLAIYLETLDYVTYAILLNVPVDILYTDFLKVFDKVNHRLLLRKLKAYGFSDFLLDWIAKFLSNRKQRVVIDLFGSTWKDVLSGVIQSSILGSILFLFT